MVKKPSARAASPRKVAGKKAPAALSSDKKADESGKDLTGVIDPATVAINVTRTLLDMIARNTLLSESGEWAYGETGIAEIRVEIYGLLHPKASRPKATWGQIVTRDTLKASEVESLVDKAVQALEANSVLIRGSGKVGFTTIGYRRYLRAIQSSTDVAQLAAPPVPRSEAATTQAAKFVFALTESQRKALRSELLALIYDFNARFNKKIPIDELTLRYASRLDPGVKRFYSWNKVTESKQYAKIGAVELHEAVRAEVFGAFRDNLIDYLPLNGLIEITASGQAALKTSGPHSAPIPPKAVTTRVIHLSDLHFGAHKFTAIDNKEGLSRRDLSPIELPILSRLAAKIKELASADSVLVVSGDITSKNEEIGYSEFARYLESLPFGRQRTYLVPGNHDYDRKATPGRMRHAGFLAHLSDYANPLSKTPYLLDEGSRTFVLGFNSVHASEAGDELFYVSQEEIDQRRELVAKLDGEEKLKNVLKIAVIHNSPLPHSGIEIKKHSELLNLFRLKYELISWGFSTVLAGHKHDPLFERHQTFAAEGAGALLLMSAASAAGQVVGGKNGFHVIDYERDANTGVLLRTRVTPYEVDRLGAFQEKGRFVIDG